MSEVDEILRRAYKPKKEPQPVEVKKEEKPVTREQPVEVKIGMPTAPEPTPPKTEAPKPVEPTVKEPTVKPVEAPMPKVEEVKPSIPKVEEVKPPATKVEEVKIQLPEHEARGLQKAIEEKLILEEDTGTPIPKLVITIYGEKGTGKTTTAMSFREKVAVFSFDDKSTVVKVNMFKNDPRIKVFSPMRYWDRTDKDKIPENAKKVWDSINATLEWLGKNWKPDWIVIDAAEEFERLVEQVMRYEYGIGPYEGIANWNVWKYRRDMVIGFISKALLYANRGIIFTTYPEYSEHISQGEVVSRKAVPKWADYLQLLTDVVIYTFIDERTNEYKVKIITSKVDNILPSGKTVTVTNTTLWDALDLSSKFK